MHLRKVVRFKIDNVQRVGHRIWKMFGEYENVLILRRRTHSTYLIE